MNNLNKALLIVLIVVAAGTGYYLYNQESQNSDDQPLVDQEDYFAQKGISVTSPATNTTVTSPLSVTGQARGTWFFEASFPITVLDANGKILGQSYVQAQDEWMTEDYVPFVGSVTFTTPSTATGKLILEKDNPSGLPQNADMVEIPIRF